MVTHTTAGRSTVHQPAAAKLTYRATPPNRQLEPAVNPPSWNFAATPVSRAALLIQPKLEIGAVGDPLEREADAVAKRVMRMPEPRTTARPVVSSDIPGVRRKCSCGRPIKCPPMAS